LDRPLIMQQSSWWLSW